MNQAVRRGAVLWLSCGLALGCHPGAAPGPGPRPEAARPAAQERPAGPAAAGARAPLADAERARALDRDLQGLFVRDAAAYRAAYGRISRRARDGDRGAQTALFVYTVRDTMQGGCEGPEDRRNFLQQVDILEAHLKDGPPVEWAVAGPTFLLGLQAAGRLADQPRHAQRVIAAAEGVWREDGAARGAVLFEVAHALRLGCHLKEALPVLEAAVGLLGQGAGARGAPALLSRRDLATLRFLLGDGQGAQRDLEALDEDLQRAAQAPMPAEGEQDVRREVVATLREHLRDVVSAGAPMGPSLPPRETGPGWQALRTVQQQASCPEATPANPGLLRVPMPPPQCSVANKQ